MISPGLHAGWRRGFPSRLCAAAPEKRRCWASCLGARRSPGVWRDYRAGGQVMHGKTQSIEHNGEGVFQGLNNPPGGDPLSSLVITPSTPSEFNVTARSASD